MDELAQELVDRVIDDYYTLADNAMEAMGSCGHVCKRWLPRSRYYVFSNVMIGAKNLRTFIDVVAGSSLPILSFIRHLELQYDGNSLDTLLLARLHQCPNLGSIDILITGGSDSAVVAWLDSREALHTHLQSWSENSISLSRLDVNFSLRKMLELSLGTIINVISCVPTIETLGLRNIYGLSEYAPAQLSFAPSRLAHLDLQVYQRGSVFFSWLLSLPVLPILKSVTFVGHVETHDIPTIVAYFQRAGDKLESLALTDFSASPDTLALPRGITKYTTNLRNLTFIAEIPVEILDTLHFLPASRYWEAIDARLVLQLDDIPWGILDAVLADPRFRTLQQFRIISAVDHVPVLTSETKLLMPLANARGIL
ncbi:hypothetical protein FB451DRAFT_1247710, partial [Mycena latifolia]